MWGASFGLLCCASCRYVCGLSPATACLPAACLQRRVAEAGGILPLASLLDNSSSVSHPQVRTCHTHYRPLHSSAHMPHAHMLHITCNSRAGHPLSHVCAKKMNNKSITPYSLRRAYLQPPMSLLHVITPCHMCVLPLSRLVTCECFPYHTLSHVRAPLITPCHMCVPPLSHLVTCACPLITHCHMCVPPLIPRPPHAHATLAAAGAAPGGCVGAAGRPARPDQAAEPPAGAGPGVCVHAAAQHGL